MSKKFIALSLAVLAMASHMVSAYAHDIPKVTIYKSTGQWTGNKVIGKIYPDPNSSNDQTFYASAKADKRCNYIYTQIFLEDAETNADIATHMAYGHSMDYIDVPAHVTDGNHTYVRVTGIHQVSSSDNNITADFGLCDIYKQ